MANRVAAFYCVYDDDEWLRYSLQSVYPAVAAIYFFVSCRPWRGPLTDNRGTLECIRSFPDPESKIKLIQGEWEDEVVQRNDAIALMAKDGFEYGFIVDADEIDDTESLKNMINFALQSPEVGCWHCWFVVFWKSHRFRIDPPENHHPPVLLKLGTGDFKEYRNCKSHSHRLIPAEVGVCFHMSYARTDEQILKKISSFSHSHQVRAGWFENTWKAWDNDHSITDLCPYNPGVFHRAVEVPSEVLPPVLRGLGVIGQS